MKTGMKMLLAVMICVLVSSVCTAEIVSVIVGFPDISKEDAAGKTVVRKLEVAKEKYVVFTCEYSAQGDAFSVAVDYEDEEFYETTGKGRVKKTVKAKTTEGEEIEFLFEWAVTESEDGKTFNIVTVVVNPPEKPEYAGKEKSFVLKDTEGREIEIKVNYTS